MLADVSSIRKALYNRSPQYGANLQGGPEAWWCDSGPGKSHHLEQTFCLQVNHAGDGEYPRPGKPPRSTSLLALWSNTWSWRDGWSAISAVLPYRTFFPFDVGYDALALCGFEKLMARGKPSFYAPPAWRPQLSIYPMARHLLSPPSSRGCHSNPMTWMSTNRYFLPDGR